MSKPRPRPDVSPRSITSRDLDSFSRWSDLLADHLPAAAIWRHADLDAPGSFQKALQMEWVVRLPTVAEGLLAKMYRLSRMLDSPDSAAHGFSDAFWKAGVFPNHPRVCALLSKKFPEHPGQLQLERLDKPAVDAMSENAEAHMHNLEPWIMLLIDLMAFREQALRLILDLSSTVITLLPHQNSLILHAFMDLFCSFVRVNLFSSKIPRKMLVQVYNLLHSMLRSGRDFDIYNRLVQFIDSYDPPLKGLQEDLNFVSPRIGEVLEAVGPIIFLSTDTRKLRNEGFLSPFHPRYPDILTNSAHPLRAQDLANVTSYREWVLFGYLVCPEELLRVTSIDISMVSRMLREQSRRTSYSAHFESPKPYYGDNFLYLSGIRVVLKENLILTLFRDEYILLHEEYQLHVLPRILESKKLAKSGRTKLKEADLEYNVAKQVEKMISEVHDQALLSCGAIHFERRVLLKQEIGRMVLFFADQPSLLAPNIQMVFSALALAQYEIIWFFQHAGVSSSRNKSVAVGIDASDSTVGFLLDGMDRLCSLVRKYIAAIRGYALSYLLSCAGRIRFLLGTPGMVALDLDSTLKNLFQKVVNSLESIPKPHAENASTVTCNLSDLRKHWLSILMIVTSSRSSINIRHLEKATVSTGKEGLLSEGNMAFSWSRCVDELEFQLSKHGSLKKLYFYHNHLTAVFRNTMFGPEGRPQHCLAWLGVANSFADCASVAFPEELNKIGRDAVLYVESLIESIMGGLEGLINILDSEGGFGPLEMQLRPEQVMGYAAHLNRTSTPLKSFKGAQNFPLPGHESYPGSNATIKMLEAAVQRLTNLCSVLNELEPICILNHVFVLREYMRECILGNFKKRLFAVLRIESYLQRPSVMESLLRRHVSIILLIEQHVSMDLTEGVREILLSEAFSGPMHSLQTFDKINDLTTGSAIEIISNWYIEYIVKDKSNAGILFAPISKCFKSPKVFGGNSAESFTTTEELKSIARIFGGYGLDRFDRVLRDYVASLLSCINTSLRSNHEALEAIAGSLNSCDRIEREANLKQILDMDTVLGFCLQIGQAVAFHHILVEAARTVLEEKACLVTSLLSGVIKQLPDEIPEKDEIKRLRRVASSVGISERHDSEWMYSIMKDVVCCSDNSWSLLPYLCSAFMDSSTWNTATYDVSTGGFSNSIYCLTRFINAVIPGGEFVRSEKAGEQRQPLSNGHSNDNAEQELQGRGWVEANIKASMELYVKCSALVLLESCNDNNRCNIIPKLIFLDRLCDLSPYIPRSMLEVHIPYALLRSIYRQLHSNSPYTAIELFLPSPRQSPLVPLGHSPAVRFNQGESTLQPGPHESAYRREPLYDVDGGTGHRSDEKHSRNARRSGPLEYTASRKAKFTESSSSVGRGLSPMRRFVSSRSGPLSFK